MATERANTHQNSPSADDLDRQLEEDAKQHEAAKAAESGTTEDEIEEKPVKGPKQYPREVKPEEHEENNDQEDHEEKVEEKTEEKDEESTKERIRRLAFERRERDRTIRELQEEVARLRGEKPARPDEEEINRRAEELATYKAAKLEFDQKCMNIRSEGNKKFPDFESTLATLNREQFLTNEFVAVLLEVENQPGVLDYLGKNIDIAETISKLAPHKQAVALAKISTKVSQPIPPKPQSKAAPPIKPLNGAGRATPSIESMPLREFMRLEDEKERKRRRWG